MYNRDMTNTKQFKEILDSLTETIDATIKARADNWKGMSDLEDVSRQTAHYAYSAQIVSLRKIHSQWNCIYQNSLAEEQGF